MKATQKLHDLGQSLWLDNITRDLLDNGTLKRYIDELSVTGLTSNPTIFDHAIKNSTRLRRRRSARSWRRASRARRSSSSWRSRTSPGPPTCSARSTTGPTAWTAGCRSKSRRCSPTTPTSTLAAAKDLHARAAGRTCSSRSPAPRKACRHRGGDLRRRADQRDAAVLARAVPRGGRGVPARHRAAHRRRARTRRRLGRLGVHQPLGRGGRGQGAGRAAATSSASPSPSARTRPTASCWPRRAGSAPTTPARGRSACSGPARAPRTRRPRTCSTSRRSPRRSRSTRCRRRR